MSYNILYDILYVIYHKAPVYFILHHFTINTTMDNSYATVKVWSYSSLKIH